MIKIIIGVALCQSVLAQQCTSPNFERCLCTTSSPSCPCPALTSTNALNFSSNYYSHLISVSGQGCRPCPPSCLTCTSLTSCTQCQPSFQLSSATCLPCPVNCRACSNGVCSLCNNGYYLDYYTVCQSCPIGGTNVCTISSLISCLSNYWLDNNAANCIQCDPNCQQCSSTTKCNTCRIGYYLLSNYTCAACASYCRSCLDSTSCLTCPNSKQYYNVSSSQCVLSAIPNCNVPTNSSSCQQCDSTSYLNSNSTCTSIPNTTLIANCQQYGLLGNGTTFCRNCSVGYFNLSSYCQYGCSILCASCFGAHYGLCYSCITNSFLSNLQCLPSYNIESGSAFQLFYTAFNNPSFFSNGSLLQPTGCFPQTLYGETSQLAFSLTNLQSYMVALKWKIYLYNTNANNVSYRLTFSNAKTNTSYTFNGSTALLGCTSPAFADKNGLSLAAVLLSSNLVTFSFDNGRIGISELLVTGYRCGGIQGIACQQCTSTSTCVKCVNPAYYISGHTCLQTCPSSSFVRTASRSCEVTCPSATYSDYLHQYCIQCSFPCATCTSDITCLSCISSTYLYNSSCLASCPAGYYPYDLSNTCEVCLRPCLTCLSNLKCLSCLYGFYLNATYSCALTCANGYYGDINSLTCQACISPCLTCNQYVGSQCQTCVAAYYLYNSQCLAVCPAGFYSNVNMSQCLSCDAACATCQGTPTQCLSCKLGTYLFNSSCLSQCPMLYFSQAVSKSCQSCPTNCLSCLSLSYCQSCRNNSYFFPQNYSCLSICPQYYYNNEGKCSNCQLPCVTCLSKTSCLSCSGLFIYNFTCTATCPATTYGNTITMKCEPCDATLCLECFTSPTLCTKCPSPKLLFSNQCLDSCGIGYFHSKKDNSCSQCDKKCLSCLSSSICLACSSSYVLQNGTCSKSCNSGFYLSLSNSTTSCLSCGIGCSSCQSINSSLVCNLCIAGYLLANGSCITSCPLGYYSSSFECFSCPLPCLSCISQSLCTSCVQGYGAFFNGSCLAQCPLGYYSNHSANLCNLCQSSCLKCEYSATNCTSCNPALYLQFNSCLTSCSPGFYSAVNSNLCQMCHSSCASCSLQPQNCTSCHSPLILSTNLCLQVCPSGYYLSGGSCVACRLGCTSCSSQVRCLQCSVSYFLNEANLCVSNCSKTYFGYNGICRKCSYPCLECANSATCLSCLAGYYYNCNCVWSCPASSYLNLTLSTCSTCPPNCSSCTNSTHCLQCSQGVLVSGTCQQNCPLGYYSYYSVCAPCMYGCLVCASSNSCSLCYIGFLYQNLCVEMCPTGWVSLSSINGTSCQACVGGCLKCTVLPSQCISCASGRFLYIFNCVSSCPLGTYEDYRSGSCQSCTTPCSTCQNGYSCLTCIYGYILYSQPNGNQCIQGPKCPNSYYLNLQTNNCVYNCPAQLYTEPIQGTCSRPCPQTYVLLALNSTCLQFCPQGMWIDQNYACRSQTRPFALPEFNCTSIILRNLLIFDCLFNVEMANLNVLAASNFSIPNVQIVEILVFNKKEIRIITTMNQGVIRTSFITISLTHRYQLKALAATIGRNLQSSASLPVQNTNFTVFLSEYFAYSEDQRRTGMQLMQISQSVCIGALIFWFFALIKNLNATSLTFILLLQWLHSFSLVDTTFPSNLGQFLQGFRFANFFWASPSTSSHFLWKIDTSYREVLWGVANYFTFTTSMFPSLCVFGFFGFVFSVSWFLNWKFGETAEEQIERQSKKLKEQQGSEKRDEQSIISNVPSQKEKEQKSSQVEQNATKQNINNLAGRKVQIGQNQKSESKKVSNCSKSQFLQQQKQRKELQEEQSWGKMKLKISVKSKIINDRFYYNYCLHCILLTSSPISIAVYCQIIASNPLPLAFSLLFLVFYIAIIVKFAYFACREQKLYVSTKYWFIMFIETLIFNGLAVLSTAQIFIGVSILVLIINLYVWKRIFNTLKTKEIKHFHQINQIIRIIVLIEGLIGYTNKKNWNLDTYYSYSWVFIGTVIVLIVAVAIQSTKQFINHDDGGKVAATQAQIQDRQTNSETESKTDSNHYTSNEVIEGQQDEKKEEQHFFTEEEPVPDTQSDSDIIDFDQNTSVNREKAPKELIRYEKRPNFQNK